LQVCRKLEGGKEEDDEDDDDSEEEEEDEEELLERKAELEAQVEKLGIKDLSWRIDRAMHALRCPEPTKQVHFLSGVRLTRHLNS